MITVYCHCDVIYLKNGWYHHGLLAISTLDNYSFSQYFYMVMSVYIPKNGKFYFNDQYFIDLTVMRNLLSGNLSSYNKLPKYLKIQQQINRDNEGI